MSMQSLLVKNNVQSLRAALDVYGYGDGFCVGLDKALSMFVQELHRTSAEMLRAMRELPDLKRGYMHQQYPMMGEAWPYIRSRHWHYRKQKQRDYGKRSTIVGKGSLRAVRYNPDALSWDDLLTVCTWRRTESTAEQKRTAKHVTNKRRRADDKRGIAREYALWAASDQADRRLAGEEELVRYLADGYFRFSTSPAANVYVPPHPDCFTSPGQPSCCGDYMDFADFACLN